MKNLNILIVEDKFVAIYYLRGILEEKQIVPIDTIFTATNAQDALDIVKTNHIDLIFMDININGSIDGISCAKLANEEYQIPIIFTTAYSDITTIQEASDTNIAGYLIKPFKPSDVSANLLIALKMVEKNSKEKNPLKNKQSITVENYIYNFEHKTLLVDNETIVLTNKEILLVDIFFHNINQNLSYDMLKEKVWGNDDISDSTIRDAVSRLKRKLPGLDIENISKFGYVLKLKSF